MDTGLVAAVTGVVGGFFAGVSSSESLLLDEAGLFFACDTGVDVDNGFDGTELAAAADVFFFLSSSLDVSESDELSFFFVCVAGATIHTHHISNVH